jgi:glucokinase
LDVGGTKILGAALDPDGAVRHRLRLPTPAGRDGVRAAILDVVDQLVDEAGSPLAIGVGLPGLVDRKGVLRYGPNVPGVLTLDLTAELEQRYQVPVAIDNDASCAAMAEHRLGAARGYHHVVLATQGTGIGGGLIIDDQLVRGANGFAGEPGHLVIDPAGPRCACGTDGCWEAYASGAGLVNITRRFLERGQATGIVARAGSPDRLRGEHVAVALADGDPDAAAVVDEFASWVALGLGNLVTLLDPDLIVLGGGLTALSDQFLHLVADRLPAAVLGGDHRPAVPVVAAQLGPEAGAVGAALLAAGRAGYPAATTDDPQLGCN